MRIFNENNEVITAYNPEEGYLIDDQIMITVNEEVEAVEEQGHYEVVSEYENGGQDVTWVVDVEAVPYSPQRTEYEEIKRFVPFTETELNEKRIAELKTLLEATDYKTLKYVEGVLSEQEWLRVKAERQAYRNEINALENALTM